MTRYRSVSGHSKREVADLAVFGGRPAFTTPLHVGRPNVVGRRRLLERLGDILDRAWLTNDGPYVRRFESRLAELCGVQHCVATCNGTLALEIAARAAGLAGEVIVPAMTFIATPHALMWQGIKPVFADVDPRTHNIDPESVERLITSRTSGIVGVHLWGRACDIERLETIARHYRLQLLFDASHAFGCSHAGRMIGAFGRAEVFSFHATKFVHAWEGGAIVTNDAELAARARLMRNFGFTGYDKVACLGINAKMSEFAAAAGLTSLESIEQVIAANRRNYQLYLAELSPVDGIRLLTYDNRERSNYQYIVAEVDETETGIWRDELLQILQAENVLARRYFYPGCHRMEPYRSLSGRMVQLPVTESIAQRVLVLPTGTSVTPDDVRLVCQIIRLAVTHSMEVRHRLQVRQAA